MGLSEVEQFIESYLNRPASDVVPLLVPCVMASSVPVDENEIPIGSSKFCGAPDVPAGFEWPMTPDGPCWFLGQLNLNEISGFELPHRFPDQGLLSFFYHDAGGPAVDRSRVYQFGKIESLMRIPVVTDNRYGDDFQTRRLYSRRLQLVQGYCVRDSDFIDDPDAGDFVNDFNDEFAGDAHQFLGVPPFHQELVSKTCMLASFGECYDRVIYSIGYEPLQNLEWDRARVHYVCS